MAPLNPREQFPDVPPPEHTIESVRKMPPFSGVYVSYVNGFVVYVGESQDVTTRLARTREELADSEGMGVIECPLEYRQVLEAHFISLLNPPRNGNSSHRLDKGESEVSEIMKWRPTKSGQLSKNQNEDSERRYREGYKAAIEDVAKHSGDDITTLQKEIYKWAVGPQNDADGKLILPPEYFADGRKAPSSNGLELELFGLDAVKAWNPTYKPSTFPEWLVQEAFKKVASWEIQEQKDFIKRIQRNRPSNYRGPETVSRQEAGMFYLHNHERDVSHFWNRSKAGSATLDHQEVFLIFPPNGNGRDCKSVRERLGWFAKRYGATANYSKKSPWGSDHGTLVYKQQADGNSCA